MFRHILPNTIAPLIVRGTFLAAAAILVEAALSFLGIGIPPEIASWGNIMAEGRTLFRVFPRNIFYPGDLPPPSRARDQHHGRRVGGHAGSEDEQEGVVRRSPLAWRRRGRS